MNKSTLKKTLDFENLGLFKFVSTFFSVVEKNVCLDNVAVYFRSTAVV